MKKSMRWFAMACAAGTMAGCASERVIFATKTSVGLDVDRNPPTVAIAYDRFDGFIGPVYDNGAVPPVISSIRSDLDTFAPKIKQVYATGNAARIVAGKTGDPSDGELTGSKKTMYFGTSTTTGLKIDFDATGPTALSLGYKRKEMSVVPIIGLADGNGKVVDHYPAVLAALAMRTNATAIDGTSLGMNQFFATGYSAEKLASHPMVRSNMQQPAVELTQALPVVTVVPDDVQKEREAVADFVRSGALDANQQSLLASSLGLPAGTNALTDILRDVASLTTMDQVKGVKQKIKILFGKDL